MTFRAIYLTDVHFGASPATRKDNYNESILSKLEYCFKLASKNDAHIICGGDMFDTPKLKYLDLIPLAKLFQEYKDFVKFYCIQGNEGHDGLPETSPLTFFKMAGLVEPSEGYEDIDGVRLIFAGHGTDLEYSDDLYDPGKVNILMTHTTLVTEPTIFEHILMKDFRTKCQLVTVGHYHGEQGIVAREDGVTFIAPGAVTRRKKTKENVGRIPKACFISVEDGKIKTKLFSIPCNQDIWVDKTELEVSDEVYYDSLKKEVVNLKSLVDTTDIVGLSLEESMKLYADKVKVSEDVLSYIFKQISLTN
jgi:exonuclease SbcD